MMAVKLLYLDAFKGQCLGKGIHMQDQATLDGFDAPTAPTDRLFFALLPDATALSRVAALTRQLRDEYGLKAKPISPERLHVTLHHVGDFLGVPTSTMAALQRAMATLSFPTFEVSFDRVASFSGRPGKLPWVMLGNEGLAAVTAFQSQLDKALARAGVSKASRAHYTPHLTLLYGESGLDEVRIHPVTWSVQEFVLVHSLIGQGQYTLLGRWPLQV